MPNRYVDLHQAVKHQSLPNHFQFIANEEKGAAQRTFTVLCDSNTGTTDKTTTSRTQLIDQLK